MRLPTYEIYALRYAAAARTVSQNFITPPADPHDGPMPMDYFVWLIRNDACTVLVDTGFNADAAAQRARTLLRCPIQALAALGVAADAIEHVIITHLHYDHAGNIRLLPRARLHVQEKELHYACGCHMRFDALRHAYAVEDVVDVVRGVYDQRVHFYHGHDELFPGVQLLHIGGHTQGLQAVRVHTARGWVVLASDASHYYANMQQQSPFPIVDNVAQMLAGYEILHKFADSPDHIVPGHDPLVRLRYPAVRNGDAQIVALHVAPGDKRHD